MPKVLRLYRVFAVLVLAAVGGYGLARASSAAQAGAARQLDYLVIRVGSKSAEQLEAELDKWGQGGWRVVTSTGQFLILTR